VSRLPRLVVSIALLLTLTLIMAACQAQPAPAPTQVPAAKGEATTAPSAPSTPSTAAPSAAPTTAAGPTAADMAPDQTFRINLGDEPATIDPNRASWTQERSVIDLVFEELLKFDLKTLELQPAVAKEIPSTANGGISADGKTYTFKLRNDVKWSDGKPVTAKDFVYSVKRLLDPALAAEYASFYYDIVGAEEYNNSKEKDPAKLQALKDAVAVKAKDDYTLEFTLKNPRSSFLQVMALWPVAPLREDIITANSTPDKPDKWTEDPKTYIGNGPFKLTEWVHQDHITLVPNENYYGPKPKLQKIVYYMVTDVQANYAAYLNGEREIATVPVPMTKQVLADPNLSKQLVRGARLTTFAVQFNNRVKPFDDLRVRQAFSMAIDRDAFIDKVRSGVGKPAYSWIPPGMPGYQPDLGKEYKLDPVKAKQLLADAGYPGGQGLPKITLLYANSGNNPIMAQFMQEQFKTNLGIDITLEPTEPKAASQAINKGQFMIAFYGWGADYPDPDNWLPELFGTGAGNNHTGYSNPKVDDLMKKAIAETDPKKRMDMWAEAQKMIVADAPIAFLFYDENFFLLKPYVRDIEFSAMTSNRGIGFESYYKTWLAKH